MNFKAQIPNLITLGNLFCGVTGILAVFDPDLVLSLNMDPGNLLLLLFGLALIFDFMDGAVARLLQATSPLGKQLDSLSDLVTFGVLPALYLIVAIKPPFDIPLDIGGLPLNLAPRNLSISYYSPLILPLASAFRLAKFNVDERQGDHFFGLPTPASGLFFFSLAFLAPQWIVQDALQFLYHPFVIAGLVVGFSILMVSDLPLLSLKFKSFALRPNISRYLLLGISLVLLIIWFMEAIPFILGIYLLLSVIDLQLLNRNRT